MERVRLDPLKRRFFLLALPLVSIAVLTDWAVNRAGSRATRPAELAAIIIPLLLALLLWRKPRSLRFVEAAALTCGLALTLGRFYAILFGSWENPVVPFAAFSPWLSITLVAVFIVVRRRRAIPVAAGLYLTTVGMGIVYLVGERLQGNTPVLVEPLLHLYLANAALIAFLHHCARVLEQFERARRLARSMADLANTDPLLGIANRRQLTAMIREEIALAEDGMKPATLIMFDLDRFKEVNDTFGHEIGDEALRIVADAVKRTLRSSDRFGRWGGDEFIILADVADLTQANMLAQRIREAVQQRLEERLWRVTVSLGVTPYQRGDTVESWVRRADQALYRAKESGRNRVIVGS